MTPRLSAGRSYTRCSWSAIFFLGCTICVTATSIVRAEDPADVLAGHSFHGEAFNEGPRQAAYLMPGLGALEFPTSTSSPHAQKFINQGIAQLHGFWYYEAERSFRQAAVIDPDCAIAYWGMAMANTGNLERARGFMEEAKARVEDVTDRERRYIEAYERYCREEDDKGKKIEKKTRAQTYTRDLEEIVEEYPDDIEAKAFLALQLWHNGRADLPIVSHVAINSVIQDVFDVNPAHPAHHYRIHLWDRHKPKRALESAANCGQSLPAIAHMWHMPGHIYDKLHRYHDAVWQQEASARTDHAHMMRDRVLPDQIHNFAHNNEWLIRNLLKIGRVEDALSLAKNMLELPRHPKYNTLLKRGSTKYGRERLLLALSTYRLWPELIELADTMYLEPTSEERLQVERLKYLGVALALTHESERAEEVLAQVEQRMADNQAEQDRLKQDDEPKSDEPKSDEPKSDEPKSDEPKSDEPKSDEESEPEDDAAEEDSEVDEKKAKANRERRKKERDAKVKKLRDALRSLEKSQNSIKAALAAEREDWETALKLWDKSDLSDKLLKAEWLLAAGKSDECLKLVEKEIDDKPGQLLPLAVKAQVLYHSQGAEKALATFEEVRVLAAAADLETPLLKRLLPLAAELDLDENWASELKLADDIGDRPELDSLGPFRWHPYLAPDFSVANQEGAEVRLKNVRGKPTVVIFYLGFGCLHCVEQLHEFSPRAKEFVESGINVIAISTEDLDSLNTALDTYSKPLDIPLHADPKLKAFKAFRCFDDFEEQPLHGTFLIDPDGRVLWQDISYEPFMDVDFVLSESHRLLNLAGYGDLISKPKPQKLVGKK